MSPDSPVAPSVLRALHRVGALDDEALAVAADTAAASPDTASWRRFLQRAFLGLAAVNGAGSVGYLIVSSWQEIGRFGQLALADVALVGAAVLALALGSQRLSGRLAAAMAGALAGPATLIVAMAWPTDGETWQWLLTWTVLAVPFAALSRLPAAWLGVLALVDTTWLSAVDDPTWGGLGVFGAHATVLVVGELLRTEARWALRVAGAVGFFALAVSAGPLIDRGDEWPAALGVLVAVVAVPVAQGIWWRGARDLVLAGSALVAALGMLGVVLVRVGTEILGHDAWMALPVGALLVVVATGVGLAWLRFGMVLAARAEERA